MSEVRFFLAHAKSDEGERLIALISAAHMAISRVANGKPYTLTTGRDFFEQHFKRLGSWAAWATEVATGFEYLTRRPHFDAILVPAGRVGAGTAAIVEKALAISKPVYAYQGEKSARVVGVSCESKKDWQTGYKLTVDRDLR